MEGRPYEIVPSDASLAAHTDRFIDEATGSARAAERLAPMSAILVALLALVDQERLRSSRSAARPCRLAGGVRSHGRRCHAPTLPDTLLVQLVPGKDYSSLPYTSGPGPPP